MIRRSICFAFALTLATAASASAQYRGGYVGVGVGSPGWSYYGLPYGPYAYGYPGAAGGSWTNGHTLYGPPVPTYGPTPGAFGGGDAHRGHYTYGWFGTMTPSPRPAGLSVSPYPPGRAELTGPSVDAIAPNEVPRPQPSGPSPWVKGGLLGFGVFKRR